VQISFEEFSRGLLARNSLLYLFLYDGRNDTEDDVEAELKEKAQAEKAADKKARGGNRTSWWGGNK